MTMDQLAQHHDWIGTFLAGVVIPLAFGAATVTVFWLDAKNKLKQRKGG